MSVAQDVSANRLLQRLPAAERRRVESQAKSVDLLVGSVPCKAGQRMSHVYFPHRGFISLAAEAEPGTLVHLGDKLGDAHDYMWGMATLLDDSVIAGLAHYYAEQKPGPGISGNPKLIARGKLLYEKGDSAHSVVACSTCHGESAAGTSIFPRLAGQHAAYVVRQLQVIQHNSRNSPIMHGVIKEMDAGGMKAVAEYVQSLS